MKRIKREFIGQGCSKILVEVPPPPPKPTYAKLWREHNEVLSKLFATPHSFYGWTQRYSYGEIPPLEKIISDRVIQNSGKWSSGMTRALDVRDGGSIPLFPNEVI